MDEPLHIAVVVPCCNEEGSVSRVVAGVPRFVRTIVVVDDGSTDATPERIRALEDPRVVAVFHDRNRGVGAAVMSGYRAAMDRGADICVKMDGDGQMSPDDLPELLAPLLAREADYAKANRFAHLGALAAMPRLRLVGNGVLSFLAKLASGYWSVFDPTNGFTAARAEALRRLDWGKLARDYFFEISMLIELNIHGAVVRDVEIPARYGSERSKLHPLRAALRFPLLLAAGLMRRFYWRYVIRDFNALTLCVLVGKPLALFGAAFGAYHWWLSVATGVPATAGTVLLAALPIILGSQCLLTALVLDMLNQPRSPISAGPRVVPPEPVPDRPS